MPLHAETVTIAKRRIETLVRAARTTRTRECLLEEDLAHEHVVVERVPIGRTVDTMPAPREEGDTIILPVVEEVLVVERRLVLKEEVRLRRVRSIRRHAETVTVREQIAVVTRSACSPDTDGKPAAPVPTPSYPQTKEQPMIDKTPNLPPAHDTFVAPMHDREATETLVAVFENAAHAQAAIRDLREAGISEGAITQHSGPVTGATTASTTTTYQPERGFWASLFGGEAEHDSTVYDRSLEGGSTVVTVKAPEAEASRVMQILEQHNPVDIDERGSGYGLAATGGTRALSSGTAPYEAPIAAGPSAVPAMAPQGRGTPDPESTIQLAEERLSVGKRLVNRGGTRIRRYVVETPVEEQVTLRDEKVTLERRPVTDARPVSAADFSDKTIEMTETHEEAVIAKTAHVVEEVALRRDRTERVETVRDTVRREDVEIEQLPGDASPAVNPASTAPRRTPGV